MFAAVLCKASPSGEAVERSETDEGENIFIYLSLFAIEQWRYLNQRFRTLLHGSRFQIKIWTRAQCNQKISRDIPSKPLRMLRTEIQPKAEYSKVAAL